MEWCQIVKRSYPIKPCQTHSHPKTHYWTYHCTPERRNTAPPTRTQMQAPLTRKPWQATSPTPPTGSKLHNKEESQTSSLWKGHPKHSNLNKMKRQKNIHQIKQHDKCLPNQTKEEEIVYLKKKKEEEIGASKDDPKPWKQNGVTDK